MSNQHSRDSAELRSLCQERDLLNKRLDMAFAEIDRIQSAYNSEVRKASKLREQATFQLGQRVRKIRGAQWQGIIVGTYSTTLTPEGYAVESETENGSVQIYPVGALELVTAP